MRRMAAFRALLLFSIFSLGMLPLGAQQGEINPRIPPTPPPPESPAVQPPPAVVEPAPRLTPPVPATVAISQGTRIAVTLETPLSTRISKDGQVVTFRTVEPLRVSDQLEIPPDTGLSGSVIKVRRPGRFGKPGELRVKVDRINLSTGATAGMTARLDSSDAGAQGKISSDNNRTADLYNIALWTLQGTLVGAQVHGGKGAAVGAGAGAAVALVILMSHRGSDVYLEPGMPFLVILDEAVSLPGAEVAAAQQAYADTHRSESSRADANSSEVRRDPDNAELDRGRPRLKRRPKNPQP